MSQNLRCFSKSIEDVSMKINSSERSQYAPLWLQRKWWENTPKKPSPSWSPTCFFSKKKKHKTTTFFWMKCNFFLTIDVHLWYKYQYISIYFTSKKKGNMRENFPLSLNYLSLEVRDHFKHVPSEFCRTSLLKPSPPPPHVFCSKVDWNLKPS